MPVQARTDAIFVGLGSSAIQPGPGHVPIVPAQAHLAFQDALASLPPGGGTLYVMPGSADYVFGAAVTISKPNVRLDFVGGSALRFAAGAAPQQIFRVEAPGFGIGGARFVHSITAAGNPAERSCVLVQADDADVSDCTFEVRQGDAAFEIRYFACVRVLQSALSPFRTGVRVRRNTFVLDVAGFDQAAPWTPAAPPAVPYVMPRGVCCIGAERARGLLVTDNDVRSSSPGVRAACGPALYLLTCEQVTVGGNGLRDLRTAPGGSGTERASLVRAFGFVGEGHHTVFSANVFRDLESTLVIALDNLAYDVVTANVFDSIGSALRPCASVVRATEGTVLVVTGNAFTRITGAAGNPEAAIFLDGVADVTVSGNVFADVATGKGVFAAQADTCSNVHFDPQQARAGGV